MANSNGAFGLRPIGVVGQVQTPMVRLNIVSPLETQTRFTKDPCYPTVNWFY